LNFIKFVMSEVYVMMFDVNLVLQVANILKLWLEKVWSKRPSSLLKKPSLLMCNQFKAHVTESTKRLATKLKMHLAVIPGELTSQLQPLDVSVNKPFKGFMHEEWAK